LYSAQQSDRAVEVFSEVVLLGLKSLPIALSVATSPHLHLYYSTLGAICQEFFEKILDFFLPTYSRLGQSF
jgi:hypothetical protein